VNEACPRRTEAGIVAVLCLIIGLMGFDQVGFNILMTFIKPDLHLSNTQVGLLVSAYWVGFTASTYATSLLAETTGKRKLFLLITLLLFSFCSITPSYAHSFLPLLSARAAMGLLAGPMLPIAQSIIALESSSERRGINMGLVGNMGGTILGLFVAPLLLVKLATTYGWRTGFLVIPAPGLLSASLLALFVREPRSRMNTNATPPQAGRLAEVLGFRNVYLCALLCVCYLAYGNIGSTFLPMFYVNVKQFTAHEMSFMMGPVLGMSFALFSVLLPAASDRVGRRPVMVLAALLGILFPLVVIYFTGSILVLAVLVGISSALEATSSIFTATIPSETVPPRSISTAMGLVIAVGTIGGGFVGPAVAGLSADHWGLRTALILQAGCAAAAALAAAGLRETAPRKVHDPTAELASAQ